LLKSKPDNGLSVYSPHLLERWGVFKTFFYWGKKRKSAKAKKEKKKSEEKQSFILLEKPLKMASQVSNGNFVVLS